MADSLSENEIDAPCFLSTKVEVKDADRWGIYHRLQELQIDCKCEIHQPLQVQLSSAKDVVQLWSVVKQITASRYDLLKWIDRCWQEEFN